MLNWNEYKKLSPLRREEYVFKFKDTGESLFSSIVSLFRWWVIGMFMEMVLLMTIAMIVLLPVLDEYTVYLAKLLEGTAQIAEFFFWIGVVLLGLLLITAIIRQVQFFRWKKKYVKKVNKK